jgi:alkylated DNA repair dioxygenase AlkB
MGVSRNLAPFDGELLLVQAFYRPEQASALFEDLLSQIDWRQEQLKIYGRTVDVPRLMAWYGDVGAHYRYSGVDHEPLNWIAPLSVIKQDVEKCCSASFNSVMVNLYRNGRDSMGCHADNEQELGVEPLIASVSFGERRLLRFRHNRSRQKIDVELGSGDLLIMAGPLQQHWKHELPKTRIQKKARINLTFRTIYPH